jgi:hypothetical protein
MKKRSIFTSALNPHPKTLPKSDGLPTSLSLPGKNVDQSAALNLATVLQMKAP